MLFRSLYFQCMNCPGGFGGTDIWVTQRPSVNAPWGPPVNLGPTVNTPSNEAARICRRTVTGCTSTATVPEGSAATTCTSRDGTTSVTTSAGNPQ